MRTRRVRVVMTVGLAALLVVAAVVVVLMPGTVRASREGKIRVSLGDPSYAGPVARLWYVTSRHSLLKDMVTTRSTIEALVVFNRYLSPAEASSVLRECIAIEMFLADPESYVGGGVVFEPGETYAEAARRYAEGFASALADLPEKRADIEKALAGLHLVLAVRAMIPAGEVATLLSHDDVRLVDPLYHPQAEDFAASRGQKVSYLCIPIRPDGRPF